MNIHFRHSIRSILKPVVVPQDMTPCISVLKRAIPINHQTSIHISRTFATRRGPEVEDGELHATREWLANFNPDTIPRGICDVTFSRSSGPGGQNVNKVSSKATLRVPTSAMLAHIPRILHQPLLASRYHAAKSSDIVIQADDSRKQSDNVVACFRKLHEMILSVGRESVPNETSTEQLKRVNALQKAEAAGRRKLKEHQSSRKSARRSGGRGGDD